MKKVIMYSVVFVATLWAQKPNILIIQTDEHNFRTIGAHRKLLPDSTAFPWGKSAIVETPNIDALAENGSIVNKFYVTSPKCSPSRGSFVSGLYPQNNAVVENNDPLSDNVKTFAQVLLEDGYVTGYAGKWHLNGGAKPEWAPSRNFGFEDNRYMFNRGHWKSFDTTAAGPKVGCTGDCPDTVHFSTDWLTQRAIDFMELNKSKPFLYWVSLPDPHGPNSVRAPYNSMYTNMTFEAPPTSNKSDSGLPSWGLKTNGPVGAGSMAQYYGMVKCIDDNVGKILDYLKRESLYENTIVVFTSDHGDMLGEHARTNKSLPYEGSNRVAFLMQYPGTIPKGLVINKVVTTVDFMPTILSLAGVNNTAAVEGKDASDLFLGKPDQWEDIAYIRCQSKIQNWVGAYTSRYKLVYADSADPWLFDLKIDENELINFHKDPEYASIVNQLAKKLEKYGVDTKDPWINTGKINADIKTDVALVSLGNKENKFYFSPNNYDSYEISLLDVGGKLVYKFTGSGEIIHKLDYLLGLKLKKGVYFLKTKTITGMTIKIVPLL